MLDQATNVCRGCMWICTSQRQPHFALYDSLVLVRRITTDLTRGVPLYRISYRVHAQDRTGFESGEVVEKKGPPITTSRHFAMTVLVSPVGSNIHYQPPVGPDSSPRLTGHGKADVCILWKEWLFSLFLLSPPPSNRLLGFV